MKHIFIAALILVIPISSANSASLLGCDTSSECRKKTTSASPYCCKGRTEKTCPIGWTVSGTTCTRSSTSGSDSYGYYTQAYGTCETTEKTCYTPSNKSTNSDGSPCLMGDTGNIGDII